MQKIKAFYCFFKSSVSRTKSYLRLILKFVLRDTNISIAITTTKGYSKDTIPLLINQLVRHRINPKKIFVFEGGHNQVSKVRTYYNHYYVAHNSFDLTALISIIELDLNQDFWLLLHDTVELDKSFWKRFYGINVKEYECMPLRYFPSMNMGVYSYNLLLRHKQYLLSFKNTDYSTKNLQKIKSKCVLEEDFIFKNTSNKMNINHHLSQFEHISKVDYFGKIRNREVYPQLGIIKYKANYELSENYIIEL